jgi:hypothetical protein
MNKALAVSKVLVAAGVLGLLAGLPLAASRSTEHPVINKSGV